MKRSLAVCAFACLGGLVLGIGKVFLDHRQNLPAGRLAGAFDALFQLVDDGLSRQVSRFDDAQGLAVAVQEDTATGVIEESCIDVHAADYLKPFERVNVPMVVRRPPTDRLTPPTGRVDRYVVDLQDDATMAGEGSFVIIDAGSRDQTRSARVCEILIDEQRVVLSIQKPDLTDPVDACNWIHYSIRSESTGSVMADRVLATDT